MGVGSRRLLGSPTTACSFYRGWGFRFGALPYEPIRSVPLPDVFMLLCSCVGIQCSRASITSGTYFGQVDFHACDSVSAPTVGITSERPSPQDG